MPIQLTEQQAAVVRNRGGGLLVSAAAGSGKTRVLVERLLTRVTEEGLDVDRFLVITYTKAAAAELRGKIMDELARRLALSPGDRHLQRQTTLIYRAQISTIHSFCTALLRESGHVLDLDPDFRVGDDSECGLLQLRALDRVMDERYETLQQGDDFALLVDMMSAGRDDQKLMDIVLDVHARIQSHPDPVRWLQEQEAAFDLSAVRDAGDTPWGRLLMEDARAQAEHWRKELVPFLDLLAEDGALTAAYSESLCETLDGLDDLIAAFDAGWDRVRALADVPFPKLKSARKVDRPDIQLRFKAARDACKKRMGKVAERFLESSADLLADLETVRPALIALFRLVMDFQTAYEAEKRRRKLLDFSDLEHLALRVLTDENGVPTPTARRWSETYAEIMVDEYQDTNEVQNAIFDALSQDGKNLFMVGDVKQSIYRFRLADPTIFLAKYAAFADYRQAQEGQPRTIVLSKNFRSRAKVLEGVNFLFENLMSARFGELDYTEDQRLYPGLPYPEGVNDAVELNVVDMGDIDTEDDEEKPAKDLVEARFVARRIRLLLDGGFPVTEGESFRPIRPEDIAVLHRSPNSVLPTLIHALEEQNIPWQAESGGDFFAATEISVAMGLLQIVDNPRQDVALISVLRSPVYGFSGDRLAQLRAACPRGDFYTALTAGAQRGEQDCTAFLAELEELRFQSGDKSSHQLLWDIYERANLMGVFGAMEGGDGRQGNLRLLFEYARRFEGAGHKGLFAFVTHLRRLMESGEGLQVTSAAAGSGVRILSIHKSKGLEFPVVVLMGLAKRFNRSDQLKPMLFHPKLGLGPKGLDTGRLVEYPTLARKAVELKLDEEMRAEELRLLYVAMTRAREKLIMTCALADREKTVAKLAPDARCPAEPQALSTLSSVGEWVLLPVLARPEAGVLRGAAEIPLCHSCGPDWNIYLVSGGDCQGPPEELDEKGETGLHRQRRLPREQVLELLDWQYPGQGLADVPSKVTATQLKGRYQDEEAAENAPRLPRPMEFARPRFAAEERGLTSAQKGTAVHLVMQLIDLNKADTVEGVEEELARLELLECITPQQRQAVDPAKVAAFFASPLGRQAAAAADLRREFKFSLLADAGHYYPEARGERVLLQGVIDCCFTGEKGLTVVDFKTDRLQPGQEEVHAAGYREQLDIYTRALEEITGKQVTRRVLWFFVTDTAVEC